MNKEEAYTLLGLPDNSSEEQIRKKYAEIYNDYQIRLTQAPTPNLKKLYQKNLQELNDALEMLLSGSASSVMKDLPSSAPVFDSGSSAPPPVSTTRPAPSAQPKKGTAAPAKDKFKKLFGIVLVLGIILLAVAALQTVNWMESRKQVEALEADKAALLPAEEELKKYQETYSNGEFRVKNYGDAPLEIKWVIVTYRDANGNLVKFEDFVNVRINPGSEEKIEKVRGTATVWDGSVVAYACKIIYKGVEWYQGGIWSHDSKDNYLVINLQ